MRPTSSDLEPDKLSNETHCLAIAPGGWTVLYAERGQRRDEVFFETEDEACAELLLRVVSGSGAIVKTGLEHDDVVAIH